MIYHSPDPLSAGAPSAGQAGCKTAPAAPFASLAAPCSPPSYSCCSPNLSSLWRSCSPGVKKLEFLWKQSIKNYFPHPATQCAGQPSYYHGESGLSVHWQGSHVVESIVNVKGRGERRNRTGWCLLYLDQLGRLGLTVLYPLGERNEGKVRGQRQTAFPSHYLIFYFDKYYQKPIQITIR